MEKIYSASRALAVLLAIVAAFVAAPHIAVLLLVFGGVAAIGNNSEMNSRNYLIAIVLTVGAKALEVIPVAGAPGHVVQDHGNVHAFGYLAEVPVQAFLGRLVVIRHD